MNFRPPASYTRLRELGLISDGSTFWCDVDWCPVVRWVDQQPERLAQYEATQPIGDYYVFAETAGGDPWCWHAGTPTTGDEFEIHEVDLFMYLPAAPTFEDFLLQAHLKGIVGLKKLDDWELITSNRRVLEAVLSPDALAEVRSIEQRAHEALERGAANPFEWDDLQAVVARRLGPAYAR